MRTTYIVFAENYPSNTFEEDCVNQFQSILQSLLFDHFFSSFVTIYHRSIVQLK